VIPITLADEELFAVATVAARLGRADAIVAGFAAKYEQEWDDPVAGFPYALTMLAVLQSGHAEVRARVDFTEIVETLGDLLYNRPDHWLGRYLRIHARTMLPTDPVDYRGYIAAERAKAIEDAAQLIELQSRAEWRPWFACAHLLAARLAWEADPEDRDRVAALATAPVPRVGAPIPFPALGGFMRDTFLWYHGESGLPEKDTVAAMSRALFPERPPVRGTRPDRSP
jgi:hypothetical protein